MCKALDEMMEESRQEEKKEGKRIGENRLRTLIDRLLMDNRISDVQAVAKSAVKRRELYREYGIR